jgi:hypothetical protein
MSLRLEARKPLAHRWRSTSRMISFADDPLRGFTHNVRSRPCEVLCTEAIPSITSGMIAAITYQIATIKEQIASHGATSLRGALAMTD